MPKTKPKVRLSGRDGNVFSIMGAAGRALREAGYTKEEIAKYTEEATSGDYDHAIQVTMRWCDVR